MIGFSIPELGETTARLRALNQEIDRATQSFRLGVPRLVPAALPVAAGSELPPAEAFGEPIAERSLVEFPALLPDLAAVTASLGAISAQIDQATRKLGEGVNALTGALDRFNARELKIVVEGVTTPPPENSLLGLQPTIPGAEGEPLAKNLLDAISQGLSAASIALVFTKHPLIVAGAGVAGFATSLARDYLPLVPDFLDTADTETSRRLRRIAQVSKEDFSNATGDQREQMKKILLDEVGQLEALIEKVEKATKAEIVTRNYRGSDTIRQTEAQLHLDTLRDALRRAVAHSAEVLGDDLPPELKELVPAPSQPALRIEQSAIPQPAPKEFKARIELVMHSSEKIDVRRIVTDPDFTVDFYCGMNRAGTGLP
ncbi:MAG: hypothetical protein L0210_08715 [Rhodospirillales bacterium]|nr:hypothetical protein [Rhodospirillales bacterium]